jgi:hypothetical protein
MLSPRRFCIYVVEFMSYYLAPMSRSKQSPIIQGFATLLPTAEYRLQPCRMVKRQDFGRERNSQSLQQAEDTQCNDHDSVDWALAVARIQYCQKQTNKTGRNTQEIPDRYLVFS